MNQIVKEELMRSIAVFFFALIFTSFLLAKFNLPASFFTVVGFPLLITVVVLAIQVKRRSAKVYEKPNMKDVALHAVIIGVVFAIYGVFYTALTMNWKGIIYLILFPIFLLWCRRVGEELIQEMLPNIQPKVQSFSSFSDWLEQA